MTFTAPFTAVPGEVITAAGWNTAARDNLQHIWGVIGGNPGTNDLVPVSNGLFSSVWSKVPDSALADQKVSQIPPLVANLNSDHAAGFFNIANTNVGGPAAAYFHVIGTRYDVNTRMEIASYHALNGILYTRNIIGGVPQAWRSIWTGANMGSGSGLDADTVRTLVPGNGSGNIPINNAVVNTNLYATFASSSSTATSATSAGSAATASNVAGYVPGNGSGNIPINNGVTNTSLVASSATTAGSASTASSATTAGSASTAALASDSSAVGGVALSGIVRTFAPGALNTQTIYAGGGIVVQMGQTHPTVGGGFSFSVVGDIRASGSKSRVAKGHRGGLGIFYCNEAPEPRFEDFGRARLSGGSAVVNVRADFANYIKSEDYDVEVTAYGPAVLYIAERTPAHFVVKKYGGRGDVEFMWRITARQGDLERVRDLPIGVRSAA